MYSIIFLCDEMFKFVKELGFSEPTLKRYRRKLNNFKEFCNERGVVYYTPEIGQEYASDLMLPKSNKVSVERVKFRPMVVRRFNYYLDNGHFVLEHRKRKSFDSDALKYFDDEYREFKSHIIEKYSNANTVKFYTYEIYIFFKYLISIEIKNVDEIDVETLLKYFAFVKENRQRAALCAIRYYLRHIEKTDLYDALGNIKAIRKRKLIPYLSKDEVDRIWSVLKGDEISYRDKALFMLGFTLGIRACDIVNLKLSDINWDKDYISFIQRKTGNAVFLPLSPVLGNALFNYITKERENSSYDNIFLSTYPPFKPFRDHSACYTIVKKIIELANIDMGERFCGIHFLRHNVASNLINNDIPLETVAAVLGHASPDSTNIYISTNEEKLRECTLSFKLLGDSDND